MLFDLDINNVYASHGLAWGLPAPAGYYRRAYLKGGSVLNDHQGAEHFQISEVAVQSTGTAATGEDDLCSIAVSIGLLGAPASIYTGRM